MLTNKTKVIDGSTFFASQLPPLQSMKLFAVVAKTLGPALKGMGKADLKGLVDQVKTKDDVDLESAMVIVSEIAEGLDENRLETLVKKCLISDSVKKDGKAIINIDAEFEDPITVLKAVVFVLEVNFKNFLGKLGSLRKEAESPSISKKQEA